MHHVSSALIRTVCLSNAQWIRDHVTFCSTATTTDSATYIGITASLPQPSVTSLIRRFFGRNSDDIVYRSMTSYDPYRRSTSIHMFPEVTCRCQRISGGDVGTRDDEEEEEEVDLNWDDSNCYVLHGVNCCCCQRS